jgi:hypothetical protein
MDIAVLAAMLVGDGHVFMRFKKPPLRFARPYFHFYDYQAIAATGKRSRLVRKPAVIVAPDLISTVSNPSPCSISRFSIAEMPLSFLKKHG